MHLKKHSHVSWTCEKIHEFKKSSQISKEGYAFEKKFTDLRKLHDFEETKFTLWEVNVLRFEITYLRKEVHIIEKIHGFKEKMLTEKFRNLGKNHKFQESV